MNAPRGRITSNFSFKELIEGTIPTEAIQLNYAQITPLQVSNMRMLAYTLQLVRDITEDKFGKQKFSGLRIISGLRQRDWEIKQGRSGNSQHVQGWAVDFQPICEQADYMEIFNFIFDLLKNWSGGLAQKKPNIKAGQLGFIHFDLRYGRARWEY